MSLLERRASAGSVAGIASFGISFVQAVLTVPILLSYWSHETYGAWATLGAAAALLTSLDLGHQNYVGNALNRCWVEDRNNIRSTLASAAKIATVIAVVEFGLGILLVVTGRIGWLVGGGEAVGPLQSEVGLALLIYLGFWCANGSVGGLLVRLYPPAGFFAWSQWLGIGTRLVALLALIAAVISGATMVGAMVAQVAAWTVMNWFVFWDLRRRLPQCRPWWKGGLWSTGWKNFRPSLVLTSTGIIEQGAANGLVVLVAGVFAPVQVAMFTTVRTVANVGMQGSVIMLSPLAPDMVRYHINGEGGKLAAVFSTSWFLGTSLLTAGLMAGVFVLEPLYSLWTRGALPLDRMLFAFLGTAVAVRQWAAPLQTYLASMNRLRPQSVMAGTRAVLGLGLAALLMPRLGLPAAGLGAFAAEVGAAVVSVIAVRPQLRSLGAAFPVKSAVYSLIQVGLAAMVWILFSTRTDGLSFLTGVGLLIVAILAWQQWRILPNGVRERLLGLLRQQVCDRHHL